MRIVPNDAQRMPIRWAAGRVGFGARSMRVEHGSLYHRSSLRSACRHCDPLAAQVGRPRLPGPWVVEQAEGSGSADRWWERLTLACDSSSRVVCSQGGSWSRSLALESCLATHACRVKAGRRVLHTQRSSTFPGVCVCVCVAARTSSILCCVGMCAHGAGAVRSILVQSAFI